MCDNEFVKQEQMKISLFEATANRDLQENQTELAYKDLNAGYFNMEKKELKGMALSTWKEEHAQRKKAIESAWHTKTKTEITDLSKRVGSKNKKEQAYYRPFSLKELEVFIKNNDRGSSDGNSDEYNSVATELELYNRIMEKGNPLEAFGILKKLKASADYYVTKKSPHSTKGKIRKAMISEIATKATTLLETRREEYKNRAESLYKEALKSDVTDEKVNEAFKAQYDLIYQVLNGNIELSKEETERLDSNAAEVFRKVLTQKVDEGQAPNMSTKFFNSLGWSGNDARLVKDEDLDEDSTEMKNSPLKKKMYHAINPIDGMKDAKEFGRQLAGVNKKNNRLFFGLGRFGKGIYTSARNDEKGSEDRLAEVNSWTYGDEVGAVQLVMTLNENARMISYVQFMHMERIIEEKFGKLNEIFRGEHTSKAGYRDNLTMKAALFGYNTLFDYGTGVKGVDYYVTTDRKALTISREMRIRTDPKEIDYYDTERLKKQ